jgi:hypothetical protein
MAFSLGSIGAYTRQSTEPLLTAAIFKAKTQELILRSGIVLTGVKSAEAIPIMDTDAPFLTDACGWDPSGTTAFSQRTVTVGKIKVEEALCPKTLETSFIQEAMRVGATYEGFEPAAWEAAYLDRKNERIAAQAETALWQGDTASGNQNLNKFDGLIKLIDAGSPVDANVTAYTGSGVITGITAANVLTVVKACKNAIPTALKGMTDVVIFCGYDVYDLYVDAGVAANYFHYDFNDGSNYGGLKIPGTGIRLEAVHGLNGTGDLYALRLSRVALGVDAESDQTNYNLWYSQDVNEVRFRAAFKLGVNVAFTAECVKFKSTI